MKAIHFLILTLCVQTGFTQTTKTDSLYQFIKDFKEIEDSIATKINPQNTIVYKTCEGYSSFYLIRENLHWTGYFIRSLLVGGLPIPDQIDTLENGVIVVEKWPQTQLVVFNADSIVNLLFQNNITKITQISEKAIQAKLIKPGKKKGEYTFESLPYSSHDCNGTIIIYGAKKITATYRGLLIREMHITPTLKIFYDTEQILVNATKKHW